MADAELTGLVYRGPKESMGALRRPCDAISPVGGSVGAHCQLEIGHQGDHSITIKWTRETPAYPVKEGGGRRD